MSLEDYDLNVESNPLPDLTGTDKQIKWAHTIRQNLLIGWGFEGSLVTSEELARYRRVHASTWWIAVRNDEEHPHTEPAQSQLEPPRRSPVTSRLPQGPPDGDDTDTVMDNQEELMVDMVKECHAPLLTSTLAIVLAYKATKRGAFRQEATDNIERIEAICAGLRKLL